MEYKIGFIIEQVLGHITHGQNLRQIIDRDPSIRAFWGLPTFEVNGLAARIPFYRSNWTLWAGRQTRQELAGMWRQARLDVLFFHTQVTATLAQDWLVKIPSVVSLDATPRQYDSLGETYAHHPGPEWLERWKWQLNRNCFRKTRRIVTWSAWAKNGLTAEYEVPAEKVVVIPPGVNLQAWTPATNHNRSGEKVKILFVGGDLVRKGGLVLLEAFRRLRLELSSSDRPAVDLELHLVTRQSLPEEPGLFVYNTMQPNSPELKNLYFNSDIFCLPTFGDCLPMVLAEAGAAGLPVVSTHVGAISEIVRDGETGFLVPARDPVALAEAVRKLVYDPEMRRRLGANLSTLIRQEHNAEANAARLLDLLKETASSNDKQEQTR